MTREAHDPTREEMAQAVDGAADIALEDGAILDEERLRAAASALRETCAGCKWCIAASGAVAWASCAAKGGMHHIPADGTGYCFRFSPKEPR